MNRVILIGNGFDLDHGLRTSYGDFIDDYWNKIRSNLESQKSFGNGAYDFYFKDDNVDVYIKNTFSPNIAIETIKENATFINNFLELITRKQTLENWVDIEEEYYQQLKDVVQNESQYYGDGKEKTAISKLNEDFEKIKKELESYLINELNNRKLNNFSLGGIGQGFNIGDFSSEGIAELRNEYFSKTEEEQKKFNLYLSEVKKGLSGYIFCKTQIYPERTLLVNFNYTDLPKKLKECVRENAWQLDDWANKPIEFIQIHGELNNLDYPIIFGYGDEQDEAHKEIEKRGRDYLENVKTINYLKTPNYKNLLTFVESDKYQVFIMGHSCGLSDKTLLNTLFEHENCVSIKPFYYIDEKGHNNYNDIVKNIYRCFTNKSMMREKVVNLRFCNPFRE
jgi:hypothetical protein